MEIDIAELHTKTLNKIAQLRGWPSKVQGAEQDKSHVRVR